MYNPGGAISESIPRDGCGFPKGEVVWFSFCILIIIHSNEKCKRFLKKISVFSHFCIKVFNRVGYFVHFDEEFFGRFVVT